MSTLLKTLEFGNLSMKLILVPCVDTLYRGFTFIAPLFFNTVASLPNNNAGTATRSYPGKLLATDE